MPIGEGQAKRRNTINYRYELPLQEEIAVWICRNVPRKEIRRRLQERGVSPLPQDTSFQAFEQSELFRQVRERMLQYTGRASAKALFWRACSEGGEGLEDTINLTLFELLSRAFDQAKGADLSPQEISKLVSALSTAQRAEIARVQEARRHDLEELERKHAAEVAEYQAKIAQLTGTIAELSEQLHRKREEGVDLAGLADKMDEVLGR